LRYQVFNSDDDEFEVQIFFVPSSRPVFLKVGVIAPLGAILNGKGAKKQRGAKKTKGGHDRGAKQHKGGENAQPLIDH